MEGFRRQPEHGHLVSGMTYEADSAYERTVAT